MELIFREKSPNKNIMIIKIYMPYQYIEIKNKIIKATGLTKEKYSHPYYGEYSVIRYSHI